MAAMFVSNHQVAAMFVYMVGSVKTHQVAGEMGSHIGAGLQCLVRGESGRLPLNNW